MRRSGPVRVRWLFHRNDRAFLQQQLFFVVIQPKLGIFHLRKGRVDGGVWRSRHRSCCYGNGRFGIVRSHIVHDYSVGVMLRAFTSIVDHSTTGMWTSVCGLLVW